MASQQAALRKRQQIARASRVMFMWVAGASVLIGAAAVVGVFLWQRISFNQQIIQHRNDTSKILEANKTAIDGLKQNIGVLASENEDLYRLRADNDDERLQVILDALPAGENAVALGASLENRLLVAGGSNLVIEGISIDGSSGDEESSEDSSDDDSARVIPFSFEVRSNKGGDRAVQDFRELLVRLENSIRAINVTEMEITFDETGATMSVQAEAYYAPASSAALETKMLSPEGLEE